MALTAKLAAQAGVTVVSLPLVNEWTQVVLLAASCLQSSALLHVDGPNLLNSLPRRDDGQQGVLCRIAAISSASCSLVTRATPTEAAGTEAAGIPSLTRR